MYCFIKKIFFIVFCLFNIPIIYGQTGPGGIGNSDGSNGQPANLFWFRADSLNLNDNDPVTTWYDVSGNNRHYSQSTSANQPTFRNTLETINSMPVVDFDGTDDFLEDDDAENYINGLTGFTLITVIQSDAIGSDAGFFDTEDPEGGDDLLCIRYDNAGASYGGDDVIKAGINTTAGQTQMEASELIQTTDPQMLTLNWASGEELVLFENGTQDTPTGSDGILSGSISGTQKGLIGRGPKDAAAGWDGTVAEMILFDVKLNSAQRTIVDNYLSSKYNITITNDYFTGNGSYVHSISGIGQESDGSNTEANSSGLIIAQNGGLDDGDYVFFAHNNKQNDSINQGTEVTNAGVEAAWYRDWYIEKTDAGGNLGVKLAFDIGDGFEGGKYPQEVNNYCLMYRANAVDDYDTVSVISRGVQNSDQVYFTVNSSNFTNGYYTLGTVDQSESPVEGAEGRTWYTLISGNWENSDIWTLDPAGALPDNPDNEYPNKTSDNVVIISGNAVTVNADSIQIANIDIEGRLDLQETKGHSFVSINGSGKILMAEDNFPAGDATNFVTSGAGEGVVEYYGGDDTLHVTRTFFDMIINMDNATDTLTLLTDYTINNNLTLTNGVLKMNDEASTTPLNLVVSGDVHVTSNGAIAVGKADAYDAAAASGYGNYHKGFHVFEVGGDFTNQGVVRFTNQTVPDYANITNTGAVSLKFTGSQNNEFNIYNTTDLYNLVIDKGEGRTYKLALYSDNISHLALYGQNNDNWENGSTAEENANPENRKALWIKDGTLELKGNIYFPSLSEGGQRDYTIGNDAALVLNGSNVQVDITADGSTDFTSLSHGTPDNINNGTSWQGIYLMGKLQIDKGTLIQRSGEAMNFRDEAPGNLEVNGGTLEANQIAISSAAAAGTYSFTQTGGVINITGDYGPDGGNALLNLDNGDMIFSMSGGEIHLQGTTGHTPNGIHIGSDPGNYNVSGGTIYIETGGNTEVLSTAPFYNVEIVNGSTLSLSESLTALGDLTIQNSAVLDANGFDVSIGDDFDYQDGATYTHDNNTTRFIEDNFTEIYVRNTANPGDLQLYNVVIEKDQRYNTSLFYSVEVNSNGRAADNHPLEIQGDLTITRGEFDVDEWEVDIKGNIEVVDGGFLATDDPPGHVVLNGTAQQTIKGAVSDEQDFGKIELDNSNGALLLSDINVTDFELTQGIMDLDIYNLTVGGSVSTTGTYSSTLMFQTSGNASDGGLTLTIDADGTYLYPLGTDANSSTRYTPLNATFSNILDEGKVQLSVADTELLKLDLDGNAAMSYYWRVRHEGFTDLPTVDSYDFTASESDVPGGFPWGGNWRPGKVVDIVRSNEGGSNLSGSIVTFDGGGTGFTLEEGDYTAAEVNAFTGNLRIFYSRGGQGTKNWNDRNTWSFDGHEGSAVPGGQMPPEAGDIVIIGFNPSVVNGYHWVVMNTNNQEVAEVRFAGDGSTWNPRLYINEGDVQNLGKVSGRGDIRLYVTPGNIPTVNGDIGDFLNGEFNTFAYHIDANGHVDIPSNIDIYPNLRIEAGGATLGNRTLSFQADISVKRNMTVDGNSTVVIDDGANGNIDVANNLYIGGYLAGQLNYPSSGGNKNITVDGDVVVRNSSGSNAFTVLNSVPNNLEHRIAIGGNLIQDEGTIDFFTNNTGGNNVILEIVGELDGEYTRTAGNVPDLYRIEMNKLNGKDFIFNDDFTLSGPTDSDIKALELLSGRLMLSDANIDITLSSGGQDFYIPADATLYTGQSATVRVTGNNTGIKLDGKIHAGWDTKWYINGGVNNYIEYTASGNAEIDIFQADFYVGSQIRRALATEAGILSFNQNHANSTIVIGTNADQGGEPSRGVFELVNTGSYFSQVAGAQMTIANGVPNASVPSFYLDLDAAETSLASSSLITFGSSQTAASQDLGLYSSVPLKNVKVDSVSGNNPLLTLQTVSLTVDTLTIDSTTTFNANGLDLNIKGDLVSKGTFTANGNKTYINGTVDQNIYGSPQFYGLYKTSADTLFLNDDITVTNYFRLESGVLADQGNTLNLKGNIYNNATHFWGGTGNGIFFNGSVNQELEGNGIYGKMSLKNIEGLTIPEVGNNVYIDDALQLEKGVFDIGKNLLELDSNAIIIEQAAFSATNMIQTNISFTDAGIRKYFPEITSDTSFIYPLGSGGKYTPVDFDISSNSQYGYIRVKAANERHPSIVEDDESPDCAIQDSLNVLQYHWLIEANNISNFDAQVNMFADEEDVWVDNTCGYTKADYITARLLENSVLWNKYDAVSFDEGANRLEFSFSGADATGINGDYTAGIDGVAFNGAIPDSVPVYHSAQNGNWKDNTTWEEDIAGGPKGAIVIIDDTVTVTKNFLVSYKTILEPTGVLQLESTFGHRLGLVSGQGTLSSWRGDLPAGDYDEFFSSSGGTLEYAGTNDLDILSGISSLNNLRFVNTGIRRFPNADITLYGNLEIKGDDATLDVINEYDRTFTIRGDIAFTGGSFDAGTGAGAKILLNGSSIQRVTGSFENTNALNYMELNNANGMEVLDSIEIDQQFTLSNGMVYLPDTALVTLNSTATNALSGAGSSRHIQGPLRKRIQNGDSYTFEIGDTSRYGVVEVSSTSPTSAQYWEAQYYDNNPHPTYDTSSYASPLLVVSGNEYWRVKGPASGSAFVKIRWDDESILPAETDDRENNLHIAQWKSTQWEDVGSNVTDNGINSGTITTDNTVTLDEHIFTLGSKESVPRATAGFLTPDTSFCTGGSADLRVELTGDPTWEIEVYKDNSPFNTYSGIGTSPFSFTVTQAGTYSLRAVTDANGAGNIYGDSVDVTINPDPTVFDLNGTSPICSNDSTELTLSGSELNVEYEIFYNGISQMIVAGSGSSISFGYYNQGGSYTVEATNTNTGCTASMNSFTLTVNTAPDPEPYTDTNPICYDAGINIPLYSNDVNAVGATYQWSPLDSLDDATIENPNYLPSANPNAVSISTMFKVTVTDGTGTCTGIDSLEIILYREPETGNQYYVPNEFDQN